MGQGAGDKLFRDISFHLHELVGSHKFVKMDENPAKRNCYCGAEEWLFSKRYPRIGEPKTSWRRMHPIKLKHL